MNDKRKDDDPNGINGRAYRRMVPDGFFAELPMWVRAIAVVGFPVVAASFLIWIGGNTIPKIQQELIVIRLQHEMTTKLEEQREQLREQRAGELFRLMQRICANGARDSNERQKCFDR